MNNEMKMYNAVRTGKLGTNDVQYPVCGKLPDYRMTHTNSAKY